ncbi:MAG TPA: CapA family protein [Peptococcaceae bacterium]|nr:CapA family protein [Peptococcaceae bacterium]HPZ71706.1 CapA family protein [Peptococcaceae bacterium]
MNWREKTVRILVAYLVSLFVLVAGPLPELGSTEQNLLDGQRQSLQERMIVPMEEAVFAMPEDRGTAAEAPGLGWLREDIFDKRGNTSAKQSVMLTISAIGDCALGAEHTQQGVTFHTVFDQQNGDYRYFFSGVEHILSKDDLTIANLETSLTDSEERADKSYLKYQYWIKGKPEYAHILAAGSVEAVSVANNHIYDYGVQGYQDTLAGLKEAGVDYFGFEHGLIKEIKGIKVGLLGFTDLSTRIPINEVKKQVTERIQAQAAETDLVIVSFHWGNEKEYRSTARQRELAQAAVDAGADLVLGHHPHVLQEIQEYNGKMIVYSLGNFCFGANRNPYDRDTMIYQQSFTFQKGVLKHNSYRVIPCSMTTVEKGNDFRPRVLEGAEAERVLQKIRAR